MFKKIQMTDNNMLLFKKGYSKSFIEKIIRKKKLSGLKVFSELKEDYLDSLEFLEEYTFLKALDITSSKSYNYDFLLNMPFLEKFVLAPAMGGIIDLSKMSCLKYLSIVWNNNQIKGIGHCNRLETLKLIDYPHDRLSEVKGLLNLKKLVIKTSKIQDLTTIAKLQNLIELSLFDCPDLKNISLIRNFENLIEIKFDSCPKVYDFSSLGMLNQVQKITLNDCKEVNSLAFLDSLHGLKELVFLGNTVIEDKNLNHAKRIHSVIYKHRKQYNLKIVNEDYDRKVENNLKKLM